MTPELSRKVLALLGGHSSQNPMPFNTLRDKSGLFHSELQAILDSLFDTRAIGRAWVTQGPTGVRAGFSFSHINPFKAVGRELVETAQTEQNEEPIMEQAKSKVQIMLDLLRERSQAPGTSCAHKGLHFPQAFVLFGGS